MEPVLDDLVREAEGCPYYRLLDMKIEEVRDGYARLVVDLGEKHLQFLRSVHGGVMASVADSAAAWASAASADFKKAPLTLEMKINFLVPVVSGRLVAEARVVHGGRTICLCDVDVKDGEGRLVAKSLVTYYLRAQ